jgi:CDP-diacylglycerol---serine O-phosphatidyltransferase
MKHLPNIITLGNLFFGCLAILFILHTQPFLGELNGEQFWISGTSQIYWGSVCILLAGVCDLLDGMVARWLGVASPLGKDLDSLADVVSFGVAPSMILMKMLWSAWMQNPNAIDIPILAVCPAFILACFGALRLARFNNSSATTAYFTGVPIPAIGIVVASFPLILLNNPIGISKYFLNPWLIYVIIAVLSWLMVSKFRLFTLKLSDFSVKKYWAQITWLTITLLAIPLLKTLFIPFSFLLYIALSFAKKPSDV